MFETFHDPGHVRLNRHPRQLSLWQPAAAVRPEPVVLAMPDADVIYYPELFTPDECRTLFTALRHETDWRQEEMAMYGKQVALPRLIAWYGDPGKDYDFGVSLEAAPWTESLLLIKARVETMVAECFNSVLLNLYRTGADSVSWHSDRESAMGRRPVIASVSFGATRRFSFRHRTHPELGRVDLDLAAGSLLVMQGGTQQHWQHQVAKTSRAVGERINLTYRLIGS